MVSFSPTEEQQQLIDTIKRFATDELQPAAHDADENERIPSRLLQTGWEMGLVQTAIPEGFGGLGELSALTGVLAAETFAYGDLSAAMQVLAPALFAYPVILYGTDAQKAQFLPLFAEADAPRATAALLEPGIFFDPLNLKTTATADGDTITLNGEKAYVPLAATADWLIIYARDSETGSSAAYIVDAHHEGVALGAREALMGVRALPNYRLHLNNVTIDRSAKLEANFAVLLNRSRVALAAMAVGVASAAAEYARNYAKQRVQFGVPIAQKQSIAFMLAEMAIEVDAARLLVWEAAYHLDNAATTGTSSGASTTKAATLAKHFSEKAVMLACDGAVQTLGGYGFIREYPAERWLRNARGFTTFHGMAII